MTKELAELPTAGEILANWNSLALMASKSWLMSSHTSFALTVIVYLQPLKIGLLNADVSGQSINQCVSKPLLDDLRFKKGDCLLLIFTHGVAKIRAQSPYGLKYMCPIQF